MFKYFYFTFLLLAASIVTAQESLNNSLTALPSATKLPIGPPVSERVCSVPKPGEMQCHALRLKQRPASMALASGVVRSEAAPSGFGPADLQSAYNLTSFSASRGEGVLVAIVDIYDNPRAESDLATYRATFGLPPCTTANGCFQKVNQQGNISPLPTLDTGWAGEISLDLDMVSAACPQCQILLVEAQSGSYADLGQAENMAAQLGAVAISNSYGSYYEDSSTSKWCDQAYNHPGIAITASTGDYGYGVSSPASCGAVTAVGGTTLGRWPGSARGWVEAAWIEGGSGCSRFITKPAWQTDTACNSRTVADVSAVADPNTGVAVYDSFQNGWSVYGGTSASAPLIAGIYALAHFGNADVPVQYAYANPSAFYDVTSGSNGECKSAPSLCTARLGYDGPTGLGTPNGIAGFKDKEETPTLAWPSPTAIPYGMLLSGSQLDAVASVPGTLTYSPSAGSLLSSGTQILSVRFTPQDNVDFQAVTGSVSLTVNKATTATNATVVTVQTLKGTEASLKSTVTPQITGKPSGTVSYSLGKTSLGSAPVGASLTTDILPVGVNQVTATYSGDSNFSGSVDTISVTSVAPTPIGLTLSSGVVLSSLPVLCTVRIPLQASKTLSGSVKLYDGTNVVASFSMPASGIWTGALPWLAAGQHEITAIYDGNSQYPSGQSAPITLIVK